MKQVAVVALVLVVAGCGGAKKAAVPETALLTGVDVQASKVVFTFKSAPQTVTERWVPRSQLLESGSGSPVPLKGAAYLMIHFQPAPKPEANPGAAGLAGGEVAARAGEATAGSAAARNRQDRSWREANPSRGGQTALWPQRTQRSSIQNQEGRGPWGNHGFPHAI